MLNGHEGILGTFNDPVHDEILQNVYGLAILHRLRMLQRHQFELMEFFELHIRLGVFALIDF